MLEAERMGDDSEVIRDLEVKIRDFINHPRLRHALTQDLAAWNVLCSALDVVGDTQLAVRSYEAMSGIEDDGARYLGIYGILQVLFVQQDAAEHILESLSIEVPETDADLAYVREIRNRATGHPTKRERRRKQNIPQHSSFITRFSLRAMGFQLVTTYEDGRTKIEEIDIPDLIQRQRASVARLLATAARTLGEREMEHRNKFKGKKLAGIFPQTMDYYLEKVSEACRGDHDRRVLGSSMVNLLSTVVHKFIEALTERGILPAYDGLRYDIDEIEYPLRELKAYFDCPADSTLNERSSYIFTFFVRHKLHELKKAAQDFDADYEGEVPQD